MAPFHCGGDDGVTAAVYQDCFRYSAWRNEWTTFSQLPGPIHGASHTHHDAWGMVMAGGGNGPANVNTAYKTTDGQYFEQLPALPVATCCGCMAAVDNTVYLAGGKI